MTDVADYDEWDRGPEPSEPPDWMLQMEAEEEERLHRLERHDGAACDCPAPEWPATEDPWEGPPF